MARKNRMGQTVGLVFYTPKYWKCSEYDFDGGWRKFARDEKACPPDWWAEHSAEQKAWHIDCGPKTRHLSHPGYVYWVGPKRRYQLHYMGAIGSGPIQSGLFSVFKHGRYVKWFS
jgi:hypothetical protein